VSRIADRAGPPLLLASCWAVMWKVAPFSDTRITDIYVYAHDAGLLASGAAPYSHAFPFEYPPLALVVIGAGHWLGGSYETTFGLLMLALALLTQWGVRALAGAGAASCFAVAPLLAGAVLRTHFDMAAAAVLIAALLAFERARPLAAFGLLGAGTMVKGFPVVLVPVAMAWCWGQGRRTTAVWGAVTVIAVSAVVSAPFLGEGYLDAYRFHLDRPVQVESTPAVVLYALGGSRVTGSDTVPDAYNSNGLEGGAAGAVQALFGVLALVAIALLSWLASLRAEPRHLTLCCAAAVLAFVTLGKVLSPQYVAWLAPLAAILIARRERAAAGALVLGILLTQVEFPSRYGALVRGDDGVRLLVGVRDAALLVALGLLIARAAAPARSTRRAAARPRTAPAPP
jgi:Glycosyltransferase family 87